MNRGSVLVTGGGGFIGSRLVAYLRAAGWQVSVFDHAQADGASTLDSGALAKALQGVDLVYHLAGVLGTTELNTQSGMATDVNIKGTINVLDACKEAGDTRVFLCTKPNDWLNTYSITKKAAEDFGRLYAACFGTDVRILRWLNVYGPGQKAYPVRKAVPMMALQALHGRPIEVFGSGNQPVDLIYVDDLARVTVEYASADQPDPTVRDTGLCVRMSVNELAEKIRAIARSSSPIVHLPMRAGEDEEKPVMRLDCPTAAEVLGLPDTPMDVDEGLQGTLDYYDALPNEQVNRTFACHTAIEPDQQMVH
jgi:UDP-glucose 4-epimerase